MRWLFIGPNPLSGIGQVTARYARLVGGEYVSFFDEPLHHTYDVGFAFVLPIEQHVNWVDTIMARCTRKMYMTVCETETVHPLYNELVRRYRTLHVPSEFCRRIFSTQFPHGTWKVLRHWDEAPSKVPSSPDSAEPYVFYTIGNLVDHRKNIKMLVEAFIRLGMPDTTRLVLKATCREPFRMKIPGVEIVNGLLSMDELEQVHDRCHCYVNCSHSEGVGMGAVEAALRNKPVIITSYGGLSEYVHTPFVVHADDLVPIGVDDFLYTKDMTWGNPRLDDLIDHMRTCATRRLTTWDHSHTRTLMDEVVHALSYERDGVSGPPP